MGTQHNPSQRRVPHHTKGRHNRRAHCHLQRLVSEAPNRDRAGKATPRQQNASDALTETASRTSRGNRQRSLPPTNSPPLSEGGVALTFKLKCNGHTAQPVPTPSASPHQRPAKPSSPLSLAAPGYTAPEPRTTTKPHRRLRLCTRLRNGLAEAAPLSRRHHVKPRRRRRLSPTKHREGSV